jgi:hypothetical protein
MSRCPLYGAHHYKIENKNGTEIGYCKCGAKKKFPKPTDILEKAIVFEGSPPVNTSPNVLK